MRHFFILFIFFISIAFSEEAPSEPLTPPDPLHLKANWWSYYDVDQERLGVRIQKTTESLENLKRDLSPLQREQADPLIYQIIIGLNTYEQLMKQRASLSPQERTPKEVYSFEEFLNLGSILNQSEVSYNSKLQKIRIEKTNLRSDQSHLDALTAAYLSMTKSSPSRVIKGLTVMAIKISISIDEKKLSLLQAETSTIEHYNKTLEKEIAFARDHVNPTTIELALLKQNIERAQIQGIKAQENLLTFQTQIGTSASLLSGQKILLGTLNRAQSQVQSIQAQVEYILGQVMKEPQKKGVKAIYLELASLKEGQDLVEREMDDWQSAAEHYLALAIAESNRDEIELAQKTLSFIQMLGQNIQLNEFLFQQADFLIHAHYVSFSDRIYEYWQNFVIYFKQISKWSHNSLFKIGQTPITTYGILKALFTIIIAYFLAKFMQRWINRVGQKQKRFNRAGLYALARLLYYCILLIGIIIAISGIGLDLTAFAVIAGALSVGIGFGLQSIVNNFVSGIIVLLEKKLRVGDYVQLESGEVGRVMEINVRTTLVKTFDNIEVLVPNADLVSKKFTNWTLSDKVRRIRIPFGVAFGSDKEKVREVTTAAALKIPITVKERHPQLWLVKIGECSLDFELVVWVNESLHGSPPAGTQAWYTWEVESALRESDIKIPYPIRDVNLYPQSSSPL